MGKAKTSLETVKAWLTNRILAIWTNLLTNHLWQRMLKNTLATTITVIIAIIPKVVAVYGKAVYLAPITTVFGHPGRRFGMMAEALVLTIAGTILGIGWSTFGLWLSSLVYATNAPAAYTIKGIFLAIALMFHGFLRSHTPRLFIFVLLLIIVSVVTLTSPATTVTKLGVTQILYPIVTAAGVLLLVNSLVFPEFSSAFLGITTIETLGETVGALRDAGRYFIDIGAPPVNKSEDLQSEEILDTIARTATLAEKPTIKSTNTGISLRQKVLSGFRKSKTGSEEKEPELTQPEPVKLKALTDSKAKLRAKLASCKAAQQECNFELTWAVLPPRDLKTISDSNMKLLVANTIALIGACESKYALMGDEDDKKEGDVKEDFRPKTVAEELKSDTSDEGEDSRPVTRDGDEDSDVKPKHKAKRRKKSRKRRDLSIDRDREDLELIKPKKEIEFADLELLKYLVGRLSSPLSTMQEKIDRSVDVVTASLAYCYDVVKLPSGAHAPGNIELEQIDAQVDTMIDALVEFDRDASLALEGAAIHDLERPHVDIMPRMEIFLISSFILNLRQTALHILEMLKHSRVIVEKRKARNGRRRLYAPRINWRKWLISGGEEDMLSLPQSGRKDARTGKKDDEDPDEDASANSKESLLVKKDLESASPLEEREPSKRPVKCLPKAKPIVKKNTKTSYKDTRMLRFRNRLADFIEYLVGSEDFAYAIKLTVAVFLVTWPAFLTQWNEWYYLNRGLWAALQLVLVTEVALGTSILTFMLRAVGTTIGCLWGFAAYQARDGNRVVCVVLLVIGIIPSTYIQLGSKYIKAGMVSIISMCIIVLATVDKTVPGTATENFLKRFIAFLIGGVVALIIEVVLFPVRARDRLVESLAASIGQISEMEACIAHGIESEINVNVHSQAVADRFNRAKGKAEGALAAAETFLPFCANEPRLKGSFKGLALIYTEILYVLHSIVDRMDNMLHLRKEYGSGVLEELNAEVFPYRRNVAGSITLILFAVHEALTTKLPLPQFLPSARINHLRMVNRVREVVLSKTSSDPEHLDDLARSANEKTMVKRIVRQKFLSWNAASAGQIEIIEYLEELIDLVKLLVGANEFRSGLLTRPTYREYVQRITRAAPPPEDLDDTPPKPSTGIELQIFAPPPLPQESSTDTKKSGLTRRRRSTVTRKGEVPKQSSGEEIAEQQKEADDELPKALQRVRTRRVEEMNSRLERTKTQEVESKRAGKKVDKSL